MRSFEAFASTKISYSIVDGLRIRWGRTFATLWFERDMLRIDHPSPFSDPHDDTKSLAEAIPDSNQEGLLESLQSKELLDSLTKDRPPREARILVSRALGFSDTEIAEAENISNSRVSQIANRSFRDSPPKRIAVLKEEDLPNSTGRGRNRSSPRKCTELLSLSEKDCLQGAANGESYREIAKRRGVSHHTVQSQIKKCLYKLQAKSATHAVYKAVSLGLIPTMDFVDFK